MELKAVVDEARERIQKDEDLMRNIAGYGLTIDDVSILMPNWTGHGLDDLQRGSAEDVMIICSRDLQRCELWIPLRGNTVRLPK